MRSEFTTPTSALEAMNAWHNRDVPTDMPTAFGGATPAAELSAVVPDATNALDAVPKVYDFTEMVGDGDEVVLDVDPSTGRSVVAEGLFKVTQPVRALGAAVYRAATRQ